MDKSKREGQLLDELKEGKDAKAFAGNPLWIEVIAEMEAMYLSSIKNNKWRDLVDKNYRDDACRRIQLLEDIKKYIERKITTGEEAHKRLEANKNGSKQRR